MQVEGYGEVGSAAEKAWAEGYVAGRDHAERDKRRERIATAALTGLIQGIFVSAMRPEADKIAHDCVTYADALIAALDEVKA